MIIRGYHVAAMFLAAAVLMAAQTPDTVALEGRVVDETGAPVAGAQITARSTGNQIERAARSDNSGRFALSGLPAAGTYSLTASMAGFVTAKLTGIRVPGGTTANIRIEMHPAGSRTEITVTGLAGGVRADEPQLGDFLTSRVAGEMPLLDRKITYLPLLNAANHPVINEGDVFMNQDLFTANGSGRRQVSFEIDGASGNDSWGRQTIFTNIPLAAVAEMTVLENAFSAEYGAIAGSAVNIVTRSGGNELHGSLLGMWRPAAPEAKLSGFNAGTAASGNDLTSDIAKQLAPSFSGPVDPGNRTQFFAAGEYTAEDRASPVTSPIAPGSFIGHYRDWLGFLRVDHEFNDRNDLFLRLDSDTFSDTNPNGTVGGNNLPSIDRIFKRRTYTAEIGETGIISASLLNNIRMQFQLASPITEFQPVVYGPQYVVPISAGGTFTSGTSQSALLVNRQYELNDTVSVVSGAQQIRFGADVLAARNGGNSKEFGGPIYDGQFLYKTCTFSLSYCESPAYLDNIANVQTYTQSYGNANYTVADILWAAFVQDDYRIRPDITVNFGLRYERQTFTDSAHDFAPRVGFAYNWRGEGRTVLRGGFGIYYSQIVDNSEANYALTGPTGVFNYTAAPGQIGFPASISAVPLPAFPAVAVPPLRSLYIRPGDRAYLNKFFPTSVLSGYPDALLNPYTEQWTFGFERQLAKEWVLSADYIGSHTLRINRPLDVDPPAPFIRTAPGEIRSAQAANCTRPYWIWWYAQQGLVCNPKGGTNPQPPYSTILSDVNDGYAYYDALDINLSHRFSDRLSMLASYVWSHAIDNVDPDVPGQNPNDPNFTGRLENGNAIFDERQRLVFSAIFVGPLKISAGGIATLGSGFPFNIVTGIVNSGDPGATTDRPVIGSVVVGRNTGLGRPIYDVSPFLERAFGLGGERRALVLRAEAFNAFNHANFVGYSGTYGNGAAPGAGFGQPLPGITNQLPARELQFEAEFEF
jgi:hypothetical protein